VLYMLGPDELARVHLPSASSRRPRCAKRARALGLRTADKRESMDVCFIKGAGASVPRRAHTAPVRRIVDEQGAVVGRHDGIDGFTIGQRRGLGVAVGERRLRHRHRDRHGDGHGRSAVRDAPPTRRAA